MSKTRSGGAAMSMVTLRCPISFLLVSAAKAFGAPPQQKHAAPHDEQSWDEPLAPVVQTDRVRRQPDPAENQQRSAPEQGRPAVIGEWPAPAPDVMALDH